MADEKLNPALHQDGDDTVTRKTIKLRPASIVTAPTIQPAASRPASNTDTGNIDIADDTQTRRTIKLKPIAPVVTAKPAAPAPAPAAAPADGDDTVTRKTIKLRPVAPGTPSTEPAAKPAAAAPTPPAAPAVAAAEPAAKPDGDDTVTRRTIKLRPVAPGTTAPEPAPAAAKPAATSEDTGEKTIRIQRPATKPVTGPAVKQTTVSATPSAGAKATPPAAMKIPTLQKPTQTAIKPAADEKAAPVLPHLTETPLATGEDVAVPNKACLILTALSLICMIYGTLLVTVHFLDLTQGQKIAEKISFLVPGPKTK